LANLCNGALRVVDRIKAVGVSDPELLEEVEDLTNNLLDRLHHYQQVLVEHGIDLPYSGSIRKATPVRLTPEYRVDHP
jgi:hypothetical protein